MPIYEYHCKACDASIEKLQKLSDDPLVNCPECGKPELRKKISAAGFRLSGSGWYETDFKKSGTKKNILGEQGGGEAASKEGADKSTDKTKGASGDAGSKSDSSKSESKSEKPSATKPTESKK